MEAVSSINSAMIRLTSERWVHIVENHDDLAGKFHDVLETVAEPDFVLAGKESELLAVSMHGRYALVAIYKEVDKKDGFVITAFQTSKGRQLIKSRKIIWKKLKSKKL